MTGCAAMAKPVSLDGQTGCQLKERDTRKLGKRGGIPKDQDGYRKHKNIIFLKK